MANQSNNNGNDQNKDSKPKCTCADDDRDYWCERHKGGEGWPSFRKGKQRR
jgi:hypothetical protein